MRPGAGRIPPRVAGRPRRTRGSNGCAALHRAGRDSAHVPEQQFAEANGADRSPALTASGPQLPTTACAA